MKTSLKPIVIIFALVATAAATPAPANKPAPAGKPTAAEAKAKAAAWIETLPETRLVLNEKRPKSGFVGRPIAGSKNTMFVLTDGPWRITLGFSGAVSEKTPVEDLRKQFSYIALDRLPLPGLDLPGWEVRPQTPTSSLRRDAKAVEILAAGDGRISIRVQTHFFAIYGRDPKVLVPADAAAPPDSYFQVRERFGLDLRLEAPFAMKK